MPRNHLQRNEYNKCWKHTFARRVDSEGLDYLAYLPCLISVFAIGFRDHWIFKMLWQTAKFQMILCGCAEWSTCKHFTWWSECEHLVYCYFHYYDDIMTGVGSHFSRVRFSWGGKGRGRFSGGADFLPFGGGGADFRGQISSRGGGNFQGGAYFLARGEHFYGGGVQISVGERGGSRFPRIWTIHIWSKTHFCMTQFELIENWLFWLIIPYDPFSEKRMPYVLGFPVSN